MPSSPTKIETVDRLNRNLGLLLAGSLVTIDIATPAGQKGKFRTTFIGYLPKKYVLVQFPDKNKLGSFSQFLTQGVAVTVRGLIEGHEGSVAAFVSTVKQTLQIPSKIMVLDFPRSLSVQSLRKSIRIDTDIVSKVFVENNYWQGLITDLSLSGCQILIKNGEKLNMTKDKSISVIIENFQDLNNLKLPGTMCTIKPVLNGVSIGVKFSENARELVIKLLHHVITLEV
ncbi:PilZ domain-containing protein [Thalassotalea sp. 1_MG-2023]|uniref:PilZ domain-containing protein n=1 Tax=Thalassotalea sp. 1_MG-2023 TaxID=3062680 RepID=UPI0026E47664|nr:PilZ domain-containing protein [Thalassotalea sp. 1_MG-2023]MDO6427445.1 PilZ domain-containing protein [Thalassotalea sp. 1_MG-2023]